MIESGAEIYELRPDSGVQQLRWSGLSRKSHTGLHAKAMVVDRRYVVVGSYDLDPRSADINTELALLVDSPAFAELFEDSFDAVRVGTDTSWVFVSPRVPPRPEIAERAAQGDCGEFRPIVRNVA